MNRLLYLYPTVLSDRLVGKSYDFIEFTLADIIVYWAPILLIHDELVFPSFHDFPNICYGRNFFALRVLLYGFFHYTQPLGVIQRGSPYSFSATCYGGLLTKHSCFIEACDSQAINSLAHLLYQGEGVVKERIKLLPPNIYSIFYLKLKRFKRINAISRSD